MPSGVASPYIPAEFDLLMQNSPPLLPAASPNPVPIEVSNAELVPLSETVTKQLEISCGKQPRQDSDVSMLDTGVSSTENSIGGNEDVQLLHSPPLTAPSSSSAPSLSDLFVKFEEIKPSKHPSLKKS